MGEDANDWSTADVVERGVSMVPENRRLFKRMTRAARTSSSAHTCATTATASTSDLEMVYDLFPRVNERREQKAGTLSGGEQQMVAMGRALMARPRLLLMDEPSMGLAPALVAAATSRSSSGSTRRAWPCFMVEQNANMALSIADRGYVIQTGQVVLDDTAENLLANPQMRQAYLGET